MKRFLVLLALVAGLAAFASCEKTSVISVDASAVLIYPDYHLTTVPVQRFDGFANRVLSDDDLEYIFKRLVRNEDTSFSSATLLLDIYDAVTDARLRQEAYAVVYNSYTGHYDFADMPY